MCDAELYPIPIRKGLRASLRWTLSLFAFLTCTPFSLAVQVWHRISRLLLSRLSPDGFYLPCQSNCLEAFRQIDGPAARKEADRTYGVQEVLEEQVCHSPVPTKVGELESLIFPAFLQSLFSHIRRSLRLPHKTNTHPFFSPWPTVYLLKVLYSWACITPLNGP